VWFRRTTGNKARPQSFWMLYHVLTALAFTAGLLHLTNSEKSFIMAETCSSSKSTNHSPFIRGCSRKAVLIRHGILALDYLRVISGSRARSSRSICDLPLVITILPVPLFIYQWAWYDTLQCQGIRPDPTAGTAGTTDYSTKGLSLTSLLTLVQKAAIPND
jgi:hypothetical protein